MTAGPVALEQLAGDPHPHLARLRAESPVAFVPALGGHLVLTHAAALAALRDPGLFTVDDPRFSTARVVGPSMLSLDGAEHARHRTPFAGPFRPGRIGTSAGPAVIDAVRRHVAAVAAAPTGRTDLRATVAGPVAATVMAATLRLGNDHDTVDRLLSWYHDIVASVSGVAAGHDVTDTGGRAMAALGRAVEGALNGSALLGAARGRLADREIVANAAVIMFGGIETTEAMILNALWFILGGPNVAGAGRPARPDPDDAGAIAAAVEESLRLEPSAAVVDRYTTRPTTLGGVDIAARSLVIVSLAAANRDPAEFAEPDRFDPARSNVRRQLAFASGPHACLGQDLARLETATAVAEVLRRLPGVSILAGSPPPTGLVFRKPERLDVTWRP